MRKRKAGSDKETVWCLAVRRWTHTDWILRYISNSCFPCMLSFLLNRFWSRESVLLHYINKSKCVYDDSKSIRKSFDQKWTRTEPVRSTAGIQSPTSDLYSSRVCKWFVNETTEQVWFASCICIDTVVLYANHSNTVTFTQRSHLLFLCLYTTIQNTEVQYDL